MFVVRLCATVQLEGIIDTTTLGAVYTQFGLASWLPSWFVRSEASVGGIVVGCLIFCERGTSQQFRNTRNLHFSHSKGDTLMRSATKLLTLCTLAAAAWTIVTYNGSASAQALVNGDLVVYYDFDSIDTSTRPEGQFLDGSGNGYNGDINEEFAGTGSLTLETTNTIRGGGAANFDQSDDSFDDPVFLDAQGNAITDDGNAPTTAVTYAMWVNLEETGSDATLWQARSASGTFQTHFQVQGNGKIRLTLRESINNSNIVNRQTYTDGADALSSVSASFDGDADADGSDFLEWQRGNGDANGDTVTDGTDLGIWQSEYGTSGNKFGFDQWVHVAATWDTATDVYSIYYNGVEIATGGPEAGNESALLGDWGNDTASNGDLFAAGTGAVEDSGGRRTQGLMDELYVFKRALSASEIATLALLPGPSSALSSVPEPGSIVLLAIAGMSLMSTRRRRS